MRKASAAEADFSVGFLLFNIESTCINFDELEHAANSIENRFVLVNAFILNDFASVSFERRDGKDDFVQNSALHYVKFYTANREIK